MNLSRALPSTQQHNWCISLSVHKANDWLSGREGAGGVSYNHHLWRYILFYSMPLAACLPLMMSLVWPPLRQGVCLNIGLVHAHWKTFTHWFIRSRNLFWFKAAANLPSTAWIYPLWGIWTKIKKGEKNCISIKSVSIFEVEPWNTLSSVIKSGQLTS